MPECGEWSLNLKCSRDICHCWRMPDADLAASHFNKVDTCMARARVYLAFTVDTPVTPWHYFFLMCMPLSRLKVF